jgi:hypothetical protein
MKFTRKKKISKDIELRNIRINEQALYEKVSKKYLILKLRLKLSFMSALKGLTLTELFLKQILKSYNVLRKSDVQEHVETDMEFKKCLLEGTANWKKYKFPDE